MSREERGAASRPRFFFDEDADARLATALRQRGFDVETAGLERGRHHSGIVILAGYAPPGVWLRRMLSLLDRFPAGDLTDQLLYLGAALDQEP